MFVGPTSSNMRYKLVDLQDFSVYWDTDTVMLGELPREQLKVIQHPNGDTLEGTASGHPEKTIYNLNILSLLTSWSTVRDSVKVA